MNAMYLLTLVAALVAAPLAYAHTDGGVAGTPKPYCEDVKGDQLTHDYGAPSTGFVILLGRDGSLAPPCPYDPQWDGHYEWAVGGAWILACESACGENGSGWGTPVCWGTYADHSQMPTIWVSDLVLSTLGLPVSFDVYADTKSTTGDPCGDFESDIAAFCVDHCSVPFVAGLDGSYQVYVTGTSGHVWTT